METSIESGTSTDEITSTIETFVAEITTTTKIDDTTFLTTTTSQDIETTTTTIRAAASTVGAPVVGCGSLSNPYITPNGDRYELRCNWKYDGYQPIGLETYDTMFEECIKACSLEPECSFAQFDVSRGNSCLKIEVGFDYNRDAPAASVAVKIKPT